MKKSEQLNKSQNDTTLTSRRIKKIQLEVWEDSEASFYLALASLKQREEIDMKDVKSLLDSINYPKARQKTRLLELQEKLRMSWQYIIQADKNSRGHYSLVSKESFSLFMHSEFGQALLEVFYYCNNLQAVVYNHDDTQLKTDLSLFSLFIESLKNPVLSKPEQQVREKLVLHLEESNSHGQTMEQIKDGIIRMTDENQNVFDLEFYIQVGDKLQKVLSFNELQDISDSPVYYVNALNGNFVITIEKVDGYLCSKYQIGASIKNSLLDLSNLKDTIVRKEAIASMPLFDPEVEAPYRQVDYITRTALQVDASTNIPISMNKELAEQYQLPEKVKKDVYVRHQIVTRIYNEVHQWFPDLSEHVKNTVTGYLSIPFNLFDSEAEHENSPRTGNYQAYVRKTIQNIRISKP